MIENAEKFFERYRTDAQLQERVLAAEAMYPGSLEIRESVAEAVLLPIAEELGLPFTIKDLRAYETRIKLNNLKGDVPIEEDEPIDDDPVTYWLLDRGWETNEDEMKKAASK